MNFILLQDSISSIFLWKNNYILLSNVSKNSIQLYHIDGYPLNIITRDYGNQSIQSPLIDNPSKIYVDENDFLYICNYNNNVLLYDLNYHSYQISFFDKEVLDDNVNGFLDDSMLHQNPIDISVGINERIIVLYTNPYIISIYNYNGEKIHSYDIQEYLIPQSSLSIHYKNNYIYLQNHSFIYKFDKNGIITNFLNDEYGKEKFDMNFKENVFYLQFFEKNNFLSFYQNNLLEFYTIENDSSVVCSKNINFPYNFSLHNRFHYSNNILLFYDFDNKHLLKLNIQNNHFEELPYMISYNPYSQYVPTTNMEVLLFLSLKKNIYSKLLNAYQNSNKYLSENKIYQYVFQENPQTQSIVIPSYELIFILQKKFLYNLQQYKNDPFIQKYIQHFPVEKYNYYLKKRDIYIKILQNYNEALLYQKLLEDLNKILFYNDYNNLYDNVKLKFDVNSIQNKLFPRVSAKEYIQFYNKKQCVILNRLFFI